MEKEEEEDGKEEEERKEVKEKEEKEEEEEEVSVSGEEEGKRVERWKGAADAFEYDKSQTLLPVMMMIYDI